MMSISAAAETFRLGWTSKKRDFGKGMTEISVRIEVASMMSISAAAQRLRFGWRFRISISIRTG